MVREDTCTGLLWVGSCSSPGFMNDDLNAAHIRSHQLVLMMPPVAGVGLAQLSLPFLSVGGWIRITPKRQPLTEQFLQAGLVGGESGILP